MRNLAVSRRQGMMKFLAMLEMTRICGGDKSVRATSIQRECV
jgi:hypothetical protein